MAMGCGPNCARITLIVINVLFWICGALLIVGGGWMLLDEGISKYIDVLSVFEDSGDMIDKVAYIVIAVGAAILIIGFFGCCGAIKESKCMLGIYMTFLIIVVIGEIAAAVLIFLSKDTLEDDLEKELTKSIDKYYGQEDDEGKSFTKGINYIQDEYKCCGVNNRTATDNAFVNSPWGKKTENKDKLPGSCCGATDDKTCSLANGYKIGCKQKLKEFIDDNAPIFAGVIVALAAIPLIALFLTICLCRNVGEDY